MSTLAPGTPIEVWFQDEMRVGQKNSLVYQWARKGSRPRQPKDQRYENAYVFGAVCPSRDTGVALIMPYADTEAMQAHLNAIGRAVAPGAHALLILDKAGWHTTRRLDPPSNLTLVPLPPACPELNAAENIWQYMRQTYLANRVFADYTAILDACQDAWRKLLAETGRITSIAARHMWNGPARQVLSSDISSRRNGAVICPAFQRGHRPLALMKFAMRGADQSNALDAHCRAGLSRLGISSRGIIV
jgi:transposase